MSSQNFNSLDKSASADVVEANATCLFGEDGV
jgi:hypothetical protein